MYNNLLLIKMISVPFNSCNEFTIQKDNQQTGKIKTLQRIINRKKQELVGPNR